MGLWRMESPESAEWAGSLETQEELMLKFKSKGHVLGEFFLAWGDQSFILFIPPNDWKSIHIMEGNLL